MTRPSGLERAALAVLAAGRLAIGVGIWLAPRPAARALGFDDLDDRELALARLLGTRDLILGGWLAGSASDPSRLKAAVRASVAADAADAAAFAWMATSDKYARAGRRGAVAALAATGLGAWLGYRLGFSYI